MNIKNLIRSDFIRDFFSYYLAKFIPGFIGIAVIPGILRIYGEAVYGEYSLSISVVQTISTFFSGWLGRSFMRFYTLQTDKKHFEAAYLSLLKRILIPVFLLPVILLWLMKFHYLTIIIAAFCGVVFTLYSYASLKFQTILRSRGVLFTELIRSVLFFSLVFVLFIIFSNNSKQKINLILLSNLIAFFIGNVFFFIFRDKKGDWKGDFWKNTKMNPLIKDQMMTYGLPLAFWMIGAFILNISDRYILKLYYDYEIVGTYSSVYDTISKFNSFMFAPLITSMQPRLIKHFNEGKLLKARRILFRILFLEILIFAVVFLVFIFTKDLIVFSYLGIDDIKATKLVIPILFGSFMWNISMLVHKPLELAQKTNLMLYGLICALIINIVLNFIFIPRYGMIAAAFTTLISTLTYLTYVGAIAGRKI